MPNIVICNTPISQDAAGRFRLNDLHKAAGLIKQCERKKTNGGVQYFWSITDDGLEFGKNVTSAQNPRQTEPHWYALKFPLLAERMGW